MNTADIITVVILGIWLLLGFRKGFVYEFCKLLVTLASFILTYFLHPFLTDTVGRVINSNENINKILFVVAFILILFVLNLVTAKLVDTLTGSSNNHILSKITGDIAALGRGVLYLSMAFILITGVMPSNKISRQISNGTVTVPIKKVVAASYETLDRFIRSNHIDPVSYFPNMD